MDYIHAWLNSQKNVTWRESNKSLFLAVLKEHRWNAVLPLCPYVNLQYNKILQYILYVVPQQKIKSLP